MTREVQGEVGSAVVARNTMWTVIAPTAWPAQPTMMSYSMLRDIETCPLRWSLRRAEYPRIWSRRGYPTAPPLATFDGQLVHVALERILQEASCPRDALERNAEEAVLSHSSVSPLSDVIGALRRLGGVTVVLEGVLAAIVSEWADNPRLAPRAHEWEIELRRRLPALRQRVQSMLARVDFSRSPALDSRNPPSHRGPFQGTVESRRHPLGAGIYPEVPLLDDRLGWHGRADLLFVHQGDSGAREAASGAERCGIIDFKTGSPKEDHALQLRIYALLWANDTTLNPSGRLISELMLIYSDHSERVPAPDSDEELKAIAEKLSERTEAIRSDLSSTPPTARPSETACQWCDVRHLCSTYWSSDGVDAGACTVSSASTDAEVRIIAQRSPTSWVAEVLATPVIGSALQQGGRVIIRTRPQDLHFTTILSPGIELRLVGAQRLTPSDESGQLPVLSLTRSSEGFVLLDSKHN